MRFVWNKALDLQRRRLEAGIPLLSYGDMAKLLTLWRSSDEYGFLALGPVHPQQWALKFLDRALWDGVMKKKGFPRFKRKGEGDALESPGKNVSQKAGLNSSILSRGWGIFLTLLGDKLSQNGGGSGPGSPAVHEPDLFRLRSCLSGKSEDAGGVRLRGLRSCGKRRYQCRKEYSQGWASPQRLFGGENLRTGCLTVQVRRFLPVFKRGVGRKESPSFPLSRRAKRKGGEDVNHFPDWNEPSNGV